jgi:hypothetical protein
MIIIKIITTEKRINGYICLLIQTVTIIGARKLPSCAPPSMIPIHVPYTFVGKSSVKYKIKTVKTKAEKRHKYFQ